MQARACDKCVEWANASAQEEEARAKTQLEYLTREKEEGEVEISTLREALKAAKSRIEALEIALKEAQERGNLTETIELEAEKKRLKLQEMREKEEILCLSLKSEREKSENLEKINAALIKDQQAAQMTAQETVLRPTDVVNPLGNAVESQWQEGKRVLMQELDTLQIENEKLRGESGKYRDTIKELAVVSQELNDKKQVISALEAQITTLRSQLLSSERPSEACLSCQIS